MVASALLVVPGRGAKWQYNERQMARHRPVGAARRIVRALGGPGVVRAATLEELRGTLRTGLPYASLDAVASGLKIAVGELAPILRLPPRTLARRKKERRFRADESDRIFRLGRVAALAEETLGGRDKAGLWLRAPNAALGGEAPLSRLDTDLGARQVEDVLLRIAHGVAS
jgi:putative toxin-antitoxin system antitoxin component (TIGR02293 family)